MSNTVLHVSATQTGKDANYERKGLSLLISVRAMSYLAGTNSQFAAFPLRCLLPRSVSLTARHTGCVQSCNLAQILANPIMWLLTAVTHVVESGVYIRI